MFRDPQINRYAQDVETLVSFYTRQLGFVETFRTPRTGVPEHVELRLGGLVLGFAGVGAARATHGLDLDTGAAGVELVLWTGDVDLAYTHLLAAGARALSAPHDFLDGRLRSAWVADPEGGPIQLVMQRATQ